MSDDTTMNETPTVEQTIQEPIKQIPCMPLNKLTDEDKRIIIEAGNQQYYDTKTYKNGNTKIIKRKTNTQQSSPANNTQNNTLNGDILNQLLAMQSTITNIKAKHKKLKSRVKGMATDFYIDDDELTTPVSQDVPIINKQIETSIDKPTIIDRPPPTYVPSSSIQRRLSVAEMRRLVRR